MIFFKVAIVLRTKMVMFINSKNSKVFEQKGDLLNFKANIDSMAMLSQVKPGWAESSWVKLSQAETCMTFAKSY